jgi:hypothetical protein
MAVVSADTMGAPTARKRMAFHVLNLGIAAVLADGQPSSHY